MKKLYALAAALVVAPMFAFASVLAEGAGQVESGDIYRVKNVTKNIDFNDPITATCNDTVQFKVRIHNPGPSRIDNVTVVATLPAGEASSHTSRVTVSSPYADPASTSDTATVNLDKAAQLSYVAGTTELLDHNGAKMSTLGDTITSTGVKIDAGVGVSLQEKRFVQFQAKVTCKPVEVPKDIRVCELATKKFITIKENEFDASKHSKNPEDCKTPEVPKDLKVCELATKKVITIKENQFDASKHSKDLNACKTEVPGKMKVCELSTKNVIEINKDQFDASKHSEDLNKCAVTPVTPEVLPNTGAGSILGLFAAVSVAAAVAHRLVWTRFSNR